MSLAADRPHPERESTPDPLIGARLAGRYLIERIHRRGGMSVIYAALHELHEREVAIKVLDESSATDPEAVERFLHEARTASSLSHGNVVAVSDSGLLPDGRPYLVMPMIAGTDLATLLAQEGPQHPRRVAALLTGVASALDAIHAKGLVHRDIKSENLMHIQGEDGTENVLVLDFGIAAALAGFGKPGAEDGSGTPEFMSPEALGGELPDQRGDVYALATVAFELMTGRLPFDGQDLQELLRNKATRKARSLWHASNVRFPEALETAIARGLAQRPEERPASAGELVSALQAAAASMPEDAATPSTARASAARYRTLTGHGRAQRVGPPLSAFSLTGAQPPRDTRRGWNPDGEGSAVRTRPVDGKQPAAAPATPLKPKAQRARHAGKWALPPPEIGPPPVTAPPPRVSLTEPEPSPPAVEVEEPPATEPAPAAAALDGAALLQSVEPPQGSEPLEPAQFDLRAAAAAAALDAPDAISVEVPAERGAPALPVLSDGSIRPPPDLAILGADADRMFRPRSPFRRWIAYAAAPALLGLAFLVFGRSQPDSPPTPATSTTAPPARAQLEPPPPPSTTPPAAHPPTPTLAHAPAPAHAPAHAPAPAPAPAHAPAHAHAPTPAPSAKQPAPPTPAQKTAKSSDRESAHSSRSQRTAGAAAAKSRDDTPESDAREERGSKARAERRAKADAAEAAQLTQTATDAMLRGDFAFARAQFQQAIDANPRHAPAWRGKALVLERMGRAKEAVKAFRQYLKLDPHGPGSDKIRARLESLEAAR